MRYFLPYCTYLKHSTVQRYLADTGALLSHAYARPSKFSGFLRLRKLLVQKYLYKIKCHFHEKNSNSADGSTTKKKKSNVPYGVWLLRADGMRGLILKLGCSISQLARKKTLDFLPVCFCKGQYYPRSFFYVTFKLVRRKFVWLPYDSCEFTLCISVSVYGISFYRYFIPRVRFSFNSRFACSIL